MQTTNNSAVGVEGHGAFDIRPLSQGDSKGEASGHDQELSFEKMKVGFWAIGYA